MGGLNAQNQRKLFFPNPLICDEQADGNISWELCEMAHEFDFLKHVININPINQAR